VATLYCPCGQAHELWGEFWWTEGPTDGSSSIMNTGAKPMLSRSRTVPHAAGGLSANVCFPDSPTVLRSVKG
jgi:hypothetical protein